MSPHPVEAAEVTIMQSIAPIRVIEAFSEAECFEILRLGKQQPAREAQMYVPVEGYRDSTISNIPRSEETGWLEKKCTALMQRANLHFQFSIDPDKLTFQYTHYDELGKVEWHTDYDETAIYPRKISMSVQLTEPSDYEGGDLEFFPLGEMAFTRSQGTAILFPSIVVHRVSQVTRGERDALVVWFLGQKFR
jgi:PKHD-type hydroxylase